MFKKLTSIEVGAHEDKVGYTATYQNGEREHHLFAPSVALQLCEHLSKLARAAQIKVADNSVTVGMAKPQTPQTERRSESLISATLKAMHQIHRLHDARRLTLRRDQIDCTN